MEGGRVETLEELHLCGLQAACQLSGQRLRALEQLMAESNKAKVCDFDLPKAAGCSCLEFASFLIRIRLHISWRNLHRPGVPL